MSMDDAQIVRDGQIPSIFFSQKVYEQLVKPWHKTIVVKLLGRNIGYNALCSCLETLWSMSKGLSIIDWENNFYLVKFQDENDAVEALTKGPWTILGYYLFVQPWSPNFDSSDDKVKYVVAWIRLPGMSLHYYRKRF